MSEKALFRVGGVYADRGGRVNRMAQLISDGIVFVEILDAGLFRYGGKHSLSDGRFLVDGDYPESEYHLIPGELHEVNGQWVPLEQSLKFPSGATLQTDGSKIVGRTEAEAPKSQIKRLAVHAEPKRDPLRWNTKTHFDAFKGFEVSRFDRDDLPGAEHSHPLQRMTDTSLPAHGSAHLLPKG